MGYYVNTTEVQFFLDKKHFEDVYKKMCELNDYHDLKRGGSYGTNNDQVEGDRYPRNKWFSWMEHNYPETCKDMISILAALDFDCEFDNDGNMTNIIYSNKTGNEDYFLQCFAGYVKDGSYIEFKGEENEDYYRFLFTDGKMLKQQGSVQIQYDDGEEYKFGELSQADTFSKNWQIQWEKERAEAKALELEKQ
jgi:hypothetical protein